MKSNVVLIEDLIGKTVLSRTTGNKLGEIYDLYVDPVEGLLVGLTIKAPNGVIGGIDYKDVSSFGQDAVMINSDDPIVPLKEEWMESHPHAKKHLIGINIVTESGELLGQVANIYVQLAAPPLIIYEVRESILDKLLGRNFFIYASGGTAISSQAERIVVPDETKSRAVHHLSELINRPQQPPPNQIDAVTDNHNEVETVIRP